MRDHAARERATCRAVRRHRFASAPCFRIVRVFSGRALHECSALGVARTRRYRLGPWTEVAATRPSTTFHALLAFPIMCGRFTIRDPRRALAEFSILEKAPALEPRFNVAPSQGVWAVRLVDASGSAALDMLRWGLAGKPQKGAASVVMVRSEGLGKRPPFAEAFRQRRCLLVADGFYEWRRAGQKSFPYYFARPDGAPFGIAAIWEGGASQGGKLDACALITRPALPPVDAVHHRMPVLIAAEHRERWLDPNFTDVAALDAMLADSPGFALVAHPVSPRVNSPANDDDGCTAPIEESDLRGEQFELFPAPRHGT